MPVVSNSKFQERMRKADHQSLRPDAWTSNVTRGVITAVYDRFSREEGDTPGEIASRLAKNPGMVFTRIIFLDGTVHFLPLDISADERHLLYGNSANMIGRPVEVAYRDQDVQNGRVYLTADNLNLGVREDKVAEPFDIASAVA